MSRSKKNYAPEFKSRLAMEALKGKHSVSELASIFNVHASLIHAWRKRLKDSIIDAFGGAGDGEAGKKQESRLMERRVEELKAEQEILRRAILSFDLRTRRDFVDPDNSDLSILNQARLLGLHRSGIYYKKRTDKEDGAPAVAYAEVQTGDVADEGE